MSTAFYIAITLISGPTAAVTRTMTTAESSSTNSWCAGARTRRSFSPGPGVATRTTGRMWRRRTGLGCERCST